MSTPSLLLLFASFVTAAPAAPQEGKADEDAIVRMLEAVGEAIRTGHLPSLEKHIDAGALLDIAVTQVGRPMPEASTKEVRNGFATGLYASLMAQSATGAWDNVRLVDLRPVGEDGQLQVTTKVDLSLGESAPMRFWVRKQEETWRIEDYCNLNLNLRATALVAGSLANQAGIKTWAQVPETLQQANQLLLDGDPWSASEVLSGLNVEALPEPLRLATYVTMSGIANGLGDSAAALAGADSAAAIAPDTPILLLVRARAHVQANNPADALRFAAQYDEMFDGDPVAAEIMGLAHLATFDVEPARACFERCLREAPLNEEAFLGLASACLEAAPLIAPMKAFVDADPSSFERMASELVDYRAEFSAAERLVEAARSVCPDDPTVAYYDGYLAWLDGEPQRALKGLEPLWPSLSTLPNGLAYVELQLDCLLELGDIHAAYEAAADKPFAFRYLANLTMFQGEPEVLLALVEQHAASHPDDPQAFLYRGVAHYEAEDPKAANEAFTAGLARADFDENARSDLLRWWTINRFEAYDLGAAYDEAPDREAVFRVLAELLLDRQDSPTLFVLTRRHREHAEDPRLLLTLEGAARLHSGDAEQAFKQMEAAPPSPEHDGDLFPGLELAHVLAAYRAGHLERLVKLSTASTERDGDPYFEVLAYAAIDQPASAIRALRECVLDLGYDLSAFVADEDVGPLLATPAYAEALAEIEEQASGYMDDE